MSDRTRLPVNPEEHNRFTTEFKAWYKKAKPYDIFVYYHGYHLNDSLASWNIKGLVWDFACEGKIYLTQRRDPFSLKQFEYICCKAKDRLPRLIPAKTAKDNIDG